ncbi:MAG: hypothetical protein R2789_17250 [Microthrixaceae bacterium]
MSTTRSGSLRAEHLKRVPPSDCSFEVDPGLEARQSTDDLGGYGITFELAETGQNREAGWMSTARVWSPESMTNRSKRTPWHRWITPPT